MKRLISRVFGGPYKELVGKDAHGNSYYKLYRHAGHDEYKRVFFNHTHDHESIPPEWKSWIQGTREEVPGDADRARNVREVTTGFGLPGQRLDHASAPAGSGKVGKGEDKSEPASRGDAFHAGEWSPDGK